jgi:hypothetical protein
MEFHIQINGLGNFFVSDGPKEGLHKSALIVLEAKASKTEEGKHEASRPWTEPDEQEDTQEAVSG